MLERLYTQYDQQWMLLTVHTYKTVKTNHKMCLLISEEKTKKIICKRQLNIRKYVLYVKIICMYNILDNSNKGSIKFMLKICFLEEMLF